MPHQRRRVCFVLPSLNGGGAERAAVQVLNGLDAGVVAALDVPVRAHRALSRRSRSGNRSAVRAVAGAWRALAVAAPVHQGPPARHRGRLSELHHRPDAPARAAQTGARVVFNQQTPMTAFLSDADYQWRHGWRRTVFTATSRLTYAAADLIIATSRGVADDLTSNFGVSPDVDPGGAQPGRSRVGESRMRARTRRSTGMAAGR